MRAYAVRRIGLFIPTMFLTKVLVTPLGEAG